MNRFKWIVFIIVLSAGALGSWQLKTGSISKSERIIKEMGRVLNDDRSSPTIALIKYDRLRVDLAEAYNEEGRPDDAIDIAQELIKKNREHQYNLYGQVMPKHSYNYFFESRYYKILARSYELKGDVSSREKALKKSSNASAVYEKMSIVEEGREVKRKAKEKADLLN